MTGASESDIRRWRRELREHLLARRDRLTEAQRQGAAAAVIAALETLQEELGEGPIAFYWPIRGEIDLRPWARGLAARGTTLALPVILEKNAPMVFRRWTPATPMTRGVWDIPIPEPDQRVIPRTVLAPLVGFDRAGYRLGYGGGYYDRTLARLAPRPRFVGVGFAFARIDDIRRQAHDQRLDLVVTEEGIAGFGDADEPVECASPPCLAREIDPDFPDLG